MKHWACLVALSVCLVACEGGEIVIFSANQAGAGGISGSAGSSAAAGAVLAGAAGSAAGAPSPGGGGGSESDASGAGGTADPPCQSNADCDIGYFCSKQRCEDAQGSCALLPIPDDDTSDMPVCGCDRTVYSNDTLRQAYGVAASTPGPCNSAPHTCFHDDECGTGVLCAHYLPPMTACGAQPGPGRCWITPAECPPVNNPQYQVCPPPNGPGGGPLPCVSRCQAIQSRHAFMQLPQDQVCP
ncbi:MAG: hypothetical protein ABUL62_12520 [Myxococcales bacterium]